MPCPVDGGLDHLAKVLVAGCPHCQLSLPPHCPPWKPPQAAHTQGLGFALPPWRQGSCRSIWKCLTLEICLLCPHLFIPSLIYMSTDSMDIYCILYYNKILLIYFVALAIGNSFWLVPESLWHKRDILIDLLRNQFSSVQFSRSVMSDSLQPHEWQHSRPPCPSSAPGVHPNSCASSRWCLPAISSSVVPFSSGPQSLSASRSFPMSQLFSWGGQSIGVSASASVLPMNAQDWSPFR